jgi:hypothetical protein
VEADNKRIHVNLKFARCTNAEQVAVRRSIKASKERYRFPGRSQTQEDFVLPEVGK